MRALALIALFAVAAVFSGHSDFVVGLGVAHGGGALPASAPVEYVAHAGCELA
jgi:hypothetical protein